MNIHEAIADFSTKQTAHNTAVSAALDELVSDIGALKQQLADAIANAGGTDADVAALNALADAAQVLEDKATGAVKTASNAPTPPTADTTTAG